MGLKLRFGLPQSGSPVTSNSSSHNGQSWASKEREASLRKEVLTDTRSPSEYRALTVRSLDEWYAAFDVHAGEKLYLEPADRVRIW